LQYPGEQTVKIMLLILKGKNAEKIFSAFDYVRQKSILVIITEAGSSFNSGDEKYRQRITFAPAAAVHSLLSSPTW
jgi:hypothetical protein